MNPLQAFYNDNDIPNDCVLALTLGVDPATVWRWRCGKQKPKHSALIKMQERYGIQVSAWYEYWQANHP